MNTAKYTMESMACTKMSTPRSHRGTICLGWGFVEDRRHENALTAAAAAPTQSIGGRNSRINWFAYVVEMLHQPELCFVRNMLHHAHCSLRAPNCAHARGGNVARWHRRQTGGGRWS